MEALQRHLRNKLLAGALAAGPIVALIWGAIWLEEHAKPLAGPLGVYFPGLGTLLAVLGVYLLGLIITSLLGKLLLRLVERVLLRIPGLNHLYRAWKDVVGTPTSKQGVFDQVVLVPTSEGKGAQLGFHSGTGVPGDEQTLCVFVPGSPNPITGRLVLVPRNECRPVPISLEEAFKFLLSTGNYLPPGLRGFPVNPQAEKR